MQKSNTFVDKNDLNAALETLQAGGILLYPTDTIWGIGCDATNEAAVEKIIRLKNRSAEKSMIVLLWNDNQLTSYVNDIPDVAYELIEASDRPMTIVYSNAKNIAKNALADDGSIGIRIVQHPFCEQLLQRFRKPIISTSANISGASSARNFDEIDQQIKDGVDYVVDFGQNEQSDGKPSIILKLDPSGRFEFIRK